MLICIDTVKLAEIARDIYKKGNGVEICLMEKVYGDLGFDVGYTEKLVWVDPATSIVRKLKEENPANSIVRMLRKNLEEKQ